MEKDEASGSADSPIVIDSDESCSQSSPVKIVPGQKFRDIVKSLCNEDDWEVSDESDGEADSKPQPILLSPTGVPIFEYPPEKYSSHQIMRILLDLNIDSAKSAKQRPLETNQSATFVVDVRSLKHCGDIKKDMYGKWVHHGSHTDVFKCEFNELSEVHVEKAAPGASGDNVYQSEQSTSRGAYQSEQSASQGAYPREQSTSRGAYPREQSTSRVAYPREQSTSRGAYQSEQSTSRGAYQSEQSTSRGAYQSEQSTSRGAYQSEQSTSLGVYQNEQPGSADWFRDASSGSYDDLFKSSNPPSSGLGQHGRISSGSEFTKIGEEFANMMKKKIDVNCPSMLDYDPMISNRLHSQPVDYTSGPTTSTECQADSLPCALSSGRVLSVSTEGLTSVSTPAEVLTTIWMKASRLLGELNAVLPAPGCDPCSRMVKSSSGQRPHLVIRKRSGQYCCDGMCPNWKSLGICSHSVAAAEDNCDLQSFVTWFAKAKKVPNITQLVTSQMPAGRGRKGSVPPRKRRKTVPPKSRRSFSDILPSSSQGEPHQEPVSMSPWPSSHPNLPQGPVSISVPSHSSSVSHTNVSVTGSASVNFGAQAMANVLPSSPPPLIQAPPETSPETSPFTVTFITRNIRVCRGCRQKYLPTLSS